MTSYNPYYNQNLFGEPALQNGAIRNPYAGYTNIDYRSQLNARFKNTNFSSAVAPMQSTQAPKGGPNVGGITSAALGGVSMINDFVNMGNEANSIQTKAPTEQYDAMGKPTYNIGRFANATSAIDPKGASGGEVLGGAAKGAAAGAAFGGVGAAVGAAIGTIGSLIGGRRRKNKMREAQEKAKRSLRHAQASYNDSVVGFTQERQAQQTYQDQMDTQARMFNLFNIQPNMGI